MRRDFETPYLVFPTKHKERASHFLEKENALERVHDSEKPHKSSQSADLLANQSQSELVKECLGKGNGFGGLSQPVLRLRGGVVPPPYVFHFTLAENRWEMFDDTQQRSNRIRKELDMVPLEYVEYDMFISMPIEKQADYMISVYSDIIKITNIGGEKRSKCTIS